MSIARDISRQTRRFVTDITSGNAGTNYTVSGGFSGIALDVYLNGSRLIVDQDYLLDGTTGIILTQSTVAGDIIEFVLRAADGSSLASENLPRSGGTMTGQLVISTGSASTPGIGITNDLNCGLAQLGGIDTLGVVTAGVERWRIAANGSTSSVIVNGSTLYPEFKCRAWVNFNGAASANLTGTYSQSGTTVTVTAANHGMSVGQFVYATITSGTAVTGYYTVASVISSSQFTYTAGTSLTTSGNITLNFRSIRASGNVSSVTRSATGDYTINLSTPMPDAAYAVMGSWGNYDSHTAPTCVRPADQSASALRVITNFATAGSVAVFDAQNVSVAFFR